jgi:hypothetical protein
LTSSGTVKERVNERRSVLPPTEMTPSLKVMSICDEL